MTDRTASADLHYTDFGDAETFRALLDRHALEYADAQQYDLKTGEADVTTVGRHIWCGENGLHLFTTANPLTGEHLDENASDKRLGYASYTAIVGPKEAAEALYRDVMNSVYGIKGEFQPLTADDGEVLAEMEEILGTTRYKL
jgi:hypothetical protein